MQFEQQASEWKGRHDTLQNEVTSLKTQLEQQSLQHQGLQRSLGEAQTVRGARFDKGMIDGLVVGVD